MALSLAALLAAPLSARADTLPQLSSLPATYAPGTPFTFEVRVPGVVDFGSYSVELLFESAVVNPDLTVTAAPDPSQYPFPSVAGFQATPQTFPGTDQYVLTISDSGPPVATTAGVNDLLAVVTVNPGPGLTGPLTISVGQDTILDYNREGRPGDTFPAPVTVQQGSVTAVPAPAAWVSLSIGGLLLAGRGLRRGGK